MKKLAAFLIASVVAFALPAKAVMQADQDDSFDFAVMDTPGWKLTATTEVEWGHSPMLSFPTVTQVECRGEGRQFDFNMNSSSEVVFLRPTFLGKPDEDGQRDEITLLGDHLWLYIDGEKWEYANIPTHSSKFSNIKYSEPEAG